MIKLESTRVEAALHFICEMLRVKGSSGKSDGVGGAQRTPFSQVGATVFCARERLGLGMAAGHNTTCGDELLLIRMESSGLHAYIEARAYSSRW